jgi:phospholipase/lecithinase/hemolysin
MLNRFEMQSQTTQSIMINLPPLHKIPYFKGAAQGTLDFFARFTSEYNKSIKTLADKSGDFELVDVYTLIEALLKTPGEFGYTGDQKCAATCTSPNEFIFWDSFHFAEKTYGYIADLVSKSLQ